MNYVNKVIKDDVSHDIFDSRIIHFDTHNLDEVCVDENIGKLALYNGVDYTIKSSTKTADRFTVSVDEDAFIEAISGVSGKYEFAYTAEGWKLDDIVVDPANYGVTLVVVDLVVGDKFVINYTDGQLAVDDYFDRSSPLYFGSNSTVDFTTLFDEEHPGTPGITTVPNLGVDTNYVSTSDFTIDMATFASAPGISIASGTYEFTYNRSDSVWYFDGNQVNLATYGLTYSGTPGGDPSSENPYICFEVYDDPYMSEENYIDIILGTAQVDGHSYYDNITPASDACSIRALANGDVVFMYNGYGFLLMRQEGVWDTRYTNFLFNDKVDSISVGALAIQDSWKHYISKTTLPYLYSKATFVNRFEAAVDPDIYAEAVEFERGLGKYVYNDGRWNLVTYLGTPIDTPDAVVTKIYYNTALTVADVTDLLNNSKISKIPAGSGELVNGIVPVSASIGGEPLPIPDSMGAFTIYRFSGEMGVLNGDVIMYVLAMESEDESTILPYSTCDYFNSMMGVAGAGWFLESSDIPASLAGIQFTVGPDYRVLTDQLLSLTPFEAEYTPVDITSYGITIIGVPKDGDTILVSLENGSYKYGEFYNINKHETQAYVEVGDVVKTLYFDTTAEPDINDYVFGDDTHGIGAIYAEQIQTPGLYFGKWEDYINESMVEIPGMSSEENDGSGSGSIDLGMFIYTTVNMNNGQPVWDSVLYSTYAVPNFNISAGWAASSYTYEVPFTAVANPTIMGYYPMPTDTNMELASKYIRKLPKGVEPVPYYTFDKAFVATSEFALKEVAVIDITGALVTYISSNSSSGRSFIFDQAAADALQNSKSAVIKFEVKNNDGTAVYLPLSTVVTEEGMLVYTFAALLPYGLFGSDGSYGNAFGMVDFRVEMVPDYFGSRYGYFNYTSFRLQKDQH